jgi:hypothetical protein
MRFAPKPGTTWWQQAVLSVLVRVLPEGNPDFRGTHDQVVEWWLEVDPLGQVSREIGFDRDHRPIVCAPIGPNMGVFTDEEGVPPPLAGELERRALPASSFREAWTRFVTEWKEAHPGRTSDI